MTNAPRIIAAAWRAAAGLLEVERAPNYCLKAARQIVEAGLGKPDGWLYSLLPAGTTRTASGAEAALHRYAVPTNQLQPGDLVFNGGVSRPYGHVALCVAPGVVLENTTAARGVALGGALRLTPLKDWGTVTSVVRLPEQ